MKLLFFYLSVLSLATPAWAGPTCSELFKNTSDEINRRAFLKQLDLEEMSTWQSFVYKSGVLENMNAYLRRYISVNHKDLSILNSDSLVSGATLVRVGQWRQLFRKALKLPAGTVLYGTVSTTSLQNIELLLEGQFVRVSISRSITFSNGESAAKEPMVLFAVELQEAEFAVPGKPELSEWILDRQTNLKVVSAEFLESEAQ
jgi:hypothetical protein